MNIYRCKIKEADNPKAKERIVEVHGLTRANAVKAAEIQFPDYKIIGIARSATKIGEIESNKA